jgi:hypothetical protein
MALCNKRFPMKKLLFASAILTMALSAFAQGTIFFQNFDETSEIYYKPDYIHAPVPVASGNLINGVGPLVVGLFWGNSASSVTTLAATAEIGSPGFISGGTVQVAGTNPGDTDWFEVVAWDSSYGTTYAAEEACRLAGGPWGSAGGPLQFPLGATSGQGTFIFQQIEFPNGLFGGISLNIPAPEPSTIGLGCLGATTLLLLRRRK